MKQAIARSLAVRFRSEKDGGRGPSQENVPHNIMLHVQWYHGTQNTFCDRGIGRSIDRKRSSLGVLGVDHVDSSIGCTCQEGCIMRLTGFTYVIRELLKCKMLSITGKAVDDMVTLPPRLK